MRNKHIILGQGRFIHKHHLRHILHHPNLKHAHGHGFNSTLKKFENLSVGESIKNSHKKQLRPLRFKM